MCEFLTGETRYVYGEAPDFLNREDAFQSTIPEDDMEDNYEDMISEVYPDVEIGCCSWSAGHVLRELDPIAFSCGVSESYEEVNLEDYPCDCDECEEDFPEDDDEDSEEE